MAFGISVVLSSKGELFFGRKERFFVTFWKCRHSHSCNLVIFDKGHGFHEVNKTSKSLLPIFILFINHRKYYITIKTFLFLPHIHFAHAFRKLIASARWARPIESLMLGLVTTKATIFTRSAKHIKIFATKFDFDQ